MINFMLLTGGLSKERDFSIKSAVNFKKFVNSSVYNVLFVEITQDRKWLLFEDRGEGSLVKKNGLFFFQGDGFTYPLDFVLPIIHGDGENGSIQGFLSTMGVKFIGNDLFSSAVSFDKVFAKIIAQSVGVDVVEYLVYSGQSYEEVVQVLGENLFIKPVQEGSSFNCFIVACADQYYSSIDLITKDGGKALIEKYVACQEISCGIIADEISDVGQVIYEGSFFSNASKSSSYSLNFKLNNETKEEVKKIVKKLTLVFGLQYARYDFFVTLDGKIYFNEVNSIPGFSSNSLFPLLFHNYSSEELVEKILNLSFN